MGYNVLLVDDSRITRNALAKTLEASGIEVAQCFHAANGREALDILDQNWVDIVFADINMPIMTGIEMIEKMHDDGMLKTIPVIMISTEGSATLIEYLKAKGVRAYIRKPFAPELVRDVVTEILGGGK
jgi:two-component system chemotaxis response regulator CheY